MKDKENLYDKAKDWLVEKYGTSLETFTIHDVAQFTRSILDSQEKPKGLTFTSEVRTCIHMLPIEYCQTCKPKEVKPQHTKDHHNCQACVDELPPVKPQESKCFKCHFIHGTDNSVGCTCPCHQAKESVCCHGTHGCTNEKQEAHKCTTQPSVCEHEWANDAKVGYARCKKCGGETLTQPSVPKIEELEDYPNRDVFSELGTAWRKLNEVIEWIRKHDHE